MSEREVGTPGMSDGYELHETQIDRRGLDPARTYTVEVVPSPAGITAVALAGELDMAAAPVLRSRVDAAAGARGVLLDLSGATFVDSSILKELLRASAELGRYETRLVLAGIPPAVRRLFDLTRTAELFTLAADRESGLRLLET
ncbi:MAG: STAS domain-containing protein [Solirubrobacteraceae bacterium]